MTGRFIGFRALTHLKPINPREHEIEQDDVRFMLLDHGRTLETIGGKKHLTLGHPSKEELKNHLNRSSASDHQNFHSPPSPLRRWRARQRFSRAPCFRSLTIW